MPVFMVFLGLLAGTGIVLAQGTVEFTTRSGTLVDAPVQYAGGGLVRGYGADAIIGQLLGGPVGGPMVLLGTPQPFRSDEYAGYITDGGVLSIPGTHPGGAAEVQLLVWFAFMGSTAEVALPWADQLGIPCAYAFSPIITVRNLGGGPTPAALMEGLQGFEVGGLCPEPSSGTLVFLGGCLWWLCRKRVGSCPSDSRSAAG